MIPWSRMAGSVVEPSTHEFILFVCFASEAYFEVQVTEQQYN